jgi:anaerobic selenocysteine-containing dehydrogenase
MRTSIARAATAAIALAVAGGASLAAATHAAAATPSYTCTSLVFVAPQPVLTGVNPEYLVGTGCNVPGYGAHVRKGIVTGQVVGWANPRSFSYIGSLCPKGLKTCDFYSPTLLPKS